MTEPRTIFDHVGFDCTPECDPKRQAHCGGPRCCPHLHPEEEE